MCGKICSERGVDKVKKRILFHRKGGRKITFRKILKLTILGVLALGIVGCVPQKSGRPELTWVVPGERCAGFDEVEAQINKITEEKLGINLKFEFISQTSDYSRRVNAKIESGEKIDLCFTGYLDSYEAKVYDNKLLPLDDLLDKTPELKSSVPEYLWDGAKIGGKIYAVPNEQICAASTALVISKELVDKYSFDLSDVRSTYDIEPFLEILKKNEPDLFPIRINWGTSGFGSMDSDRFTDFNVGGVMIINENGKITAETIAENAEKKKAVETLHSWYEKGYIRNDIAVAIDSPDDLAAGKYGVWFESYKPGVEWQRKLLTGNDVYAVQITKPYLSSSAIRSAMTGISIASKYSKEAIKLLELVNTEPEILNLLTYGTEGKNYIKVSDNVIERTENVFSYQTWVFGNQFIIYTEKEQDEDIWKKTKEINETSAKSPLIGFNPDTAAITQEVIKCNEIIGKYTVMDNGTEDPSTYWNEFRNELEKAGIEKIKRELEKQLNEFSLK